MLFTLPRYFEFVVNVERIPLNSTQRLQLQHSQLALNSIYILGYRIIGSLLFYSAVPYLVILTLSLKIYFTNKKASRRRRRMSITKQNNCPTSERLFIAIVAKFLISRWPTTALDIAEFIVGSSEFVKSHEMMLLSQISNLVVILFSASSFCIFYKFSSHFRSSFTCLSVLVEERTTELIKSTSQSQLNTLGVQKTYLKRQRSASWAPGDLYKIV